MKHVFYVYCTFYISDVVFEPCYLKL